MPIRILIVDDHPIVLHGLEQLFARHEDFTVVAACATGTLALEAVKTHLPDILLLDLRMPEQDGLAVLRQMRSQRLACRTVLLTATVRDEEVIEAVKLGVMGLVLKESSPDALLDCVRRVHAGEQWIERETATRAFRSVLTREAATREAAATLTTRELEILRMVAQGLRNKLIGERLSISEGTVKVHLHNIYEKLGVDGRLELVLCAQQKGLV